jgi:hypothetical protein
MKLVFRVHAVRRMFERGISDEDVRQVLAMGEVIAGYPTDLPYPSRLVSGVREGRPLHVVAADNTAEDETIVITAYEPDPGLWEPGFRERKPR